MSSLQPYKEKVMALLCKFLREENRLLKESRIQYLVYECPSTKIFHEENVKAFQKGKGFTNPFNRLKSCLCSGSLDDLISIYEENFQG